MKPKRIQRKRTKGWTMPENTVYVGRPTKWGNPWSIIGDRTAQEAVNLYEEILDDEVICEIKSELKGKNLACWCPLDQPCHADVLLKYANQ